jgi:hypothetical protein
MANEKLISRPLGRTLIVVWFMVAATHLWAADNALSVASDLEVNSEIRGDAVAIDGDIFLGPNAVVHGDVVSVFGTVHREPGARVDGSVLAVKSLASLDIDPVVPGSELSQRIGFFLLTAGGWLLATTLVGFAASGRVFEAVQQVAALRWRVIVLGALAVSTLFAALVAVLSLGPVWGVRLTVILMLVFLVFKVVGLTVIGAWIGRRISRRWLGVEAPVSLQVFLGVLPLLLLRPVPWVGGFTWTVLSVLALGIGVFAAIGPRAEAVSRVPVRSS